MTDLHTRIVRYLARQGTWVAKQNICDIAHERAGVTHENVGRRLRELHAATRLAPEDRQPEHEQALAALDGGHLEKKHEAKNHAHYRYVAPTSRQVRKVRIVGGTAVEYWETVNV